MFRAKPVNRFISQGSVLICVRYGFGAKYESLEH